jgi:nicotinate-nucleotide pyrophosphorylase (carboxylating)
MLLPSLVDDIIDRALAEDLTGGDLTTEACVDEDARAVAVALAKSALVVCGLAVFERAFLRVDPSLRVERLSADGARADKGVELARIEGSARSILVAERTALNLMQRMTGVATVARTYVDALPAGSRTRITDTRKTTPGLRLLERYAVRTGGAHNHRDDLGAAVLIKDNHIVAAGGIVRAIERARARAPHTSRIEVEVASLGQLEEALSARPDVIMLDNFDDAMVRLALDRVAAESPRPLVEASGGITLERVHTLAAMGVDCISVGALTHSAKAADISLDFRL